ncbi:hypothetical protein C5167_029655 [Papaver somniferum]|nr:hypothetical protein C5167_029655 [Papaver somniferum]
MGFEQQYGCCCGCALIGCMLNCGFTLLTVYCFFNCIMRMVMLIRTNDINQHCNLLQIFIFGYTKGCTYSGTDRFSYGTGVCTWC